MSHLSPGVELHLRAWARLALAIVYAWHGLAGRSTTTAPAWLVRLIAQRGVDVNAWARDAASR